MARVLVVDDSSYVRLFITKVFERNGHVTAQAENGREAVMKYRQCEPDLVIMDITMPVMDGITATREILMNHPDAAIVLVSGLEQADIVQDAFRAGACHLLTKPLSERALLDAANRALRK